MEVLIENNELKPHLAAMLKCSPIVPTISSIQKDKCLTYVAATEILKNYFEEDQSKWPAVVLKLQKNFKAMSLGLCALGEAFCFLKYLLLDVTTIPIFEYHEYSHDSDSSSSQEGQQQHSMILDAQALENLEVFEVQGKTMKQNEGSLFDYMNKCVTKFGKRLLLKWIASPLTNEKRLQDRLDAVEELLDKYECVERFQSSMKKLSDLERYLVRIYKYSIFQ